MSQWVAITILGQDRPGIVAGVTQVLYRHGCNLEDSSATRLRDAFAMILIAELPEPPRLADLEVALTATAAALEVSVDLRDLGAEPPHPAPPGRSCSLVVYGADQPGIVYHVSEAMAALGGNITDVTTHKGGPVYLMVMDLTVPEDVPTEALERRLAGLREELRVDVTLRAVEEETL